jgi:hypothetical protein
MIDPETLQREKILFAYTSALEQGDFARLETILEQAGGDAILERQIIEINAALSQPQGEASTPAGVKTSFVRLRQELQSSTSGLFSRPARYWPALRNLGVVVTVGVVVILAVMIVLGSMIRSTFQNIVNALPANYVPLNAQGQTYSAQPTLLPRNLVMRETQVVAATSIAQTQTSPYNAYPAPGSPPPTDRLIVRNGSLTVIAKDTRLARQAVMAMVAEFSAEGAFVVSSNEAYPYGDQMPVISMVLRVPVKRFDESMTRLVGLGIQVLGHQEDSQDVTQDYVDVSARIVALETSRARLLEIIKNAQNTDDLLRAEAELSRREADLEAAKGRQQYLEQTAALSSIALELQPVITSQPVTNNVWSPAATLHNAVSALLATLRGVVDFFIFFAVTILPWLVVIWLVYRLVRLILSRFKKKGNDAR